MVDFALFAANKALEKKVSEGEELKTRLEEELKEKIKKMEKELENATVKAAGKHCCENTHTHTSYLCLSSWSLLLWECLWKRITALFTCACCVPGMPSMTEEQLDAMCPSAASIAAIVKPGMKFFDVSSQDFTKVSVRIRHYVWIQ